MDNKKQLFEVIMIPVVISLVFVVITPFYEKSIEEPITTTQTFAELLKKGDVEKFNELRKDWNGKLEFAGISL